MTLLIMKTGTTLPAIRERRGDFERWFESGLGRECRVVDVQQGEPLPEPESLAGLVITGSGAMVSERDGWMEATVPWLVDAVASIPVLGVCFGHQLLAHALGGRVGPNPAGRQIGTVTVTFGDIAEDPLLGGLPSRIRVQASHQEVVLEVPADARVLGSTALDPNHVIRFGSDCWGVQFHPEFDADIIRGYLRGRREAIDAEGLDVDRLLGDSHDSPWGPRLLRRFADYCARSSEATA